MGRPKQEKAKDWIDGLKICVVQNSADTIIYEGKLWYTRTGYMRFMGFSDRSIRSPYTHASQGKAEHFNFMGISFFRPVK